MPHAKPTDRIDAKTKPASIDQIRLSSQVTSPTTRRLIADRPHDDLGLPLGTPPIEPNGPRLDTVDPQMRLAPRDHGLAA
jgi:hypothetical protein